MIFQVRYIGNVAFCLMVLVLSVSSCIRVEEGSSEQVGHLSVADFSVDVVLEVSPAAKGVDVSGLLADFSEPSASDVTFIVKDKDGNEKYNGTGLWQDFLVLPVGAYTLIASYGSNGYGAPYFYGEASGTVSALEQETAEITMTVANSLVKVSVSEEMENHFTPDGKVKLTSGTESYEVEVGSYCFVPSGTDVAISLAGTNSVGNPATFSHKLTTAPKTAYEIVCGKQTAGWPGILLSISEADVFCDRVYITTPAVFSGDMSDDNKGKLVYEASSDNWNSSLEAELEDGVPVIKGLDPQKSYKVRARTGAVASNEVNVTPSYGISASAAHTQTNGLLDGTDVTTSFSKSSVVQSAIASWNYKLYASDGQTLLREFTVSNGNAATSSDGSSLTASTAWPYLPQGSYSLVATPTMKDGSAVSGTTLTISTAAPTFSISLDGGSFTSYDKYLNRELTGAYGANEIDPETIYNVGASWTISTAIMANSNYSKTLAFQVDGAEKKSYPVTAYDYNYYGGAYDNISGLSWSAHTLAASMTFDGVTVTSPGRTHHITGLPYKSPDFVTNSVSIGSGVTDWSTSGTVEYWSGRGYQILYWYLGGVTAGTLFSPKFKVPTDTGVRYSSAVCYFTTGVAGSKSVTLYSGPTSTLNKSTANAKSVDRVYVTAGQAPSESKFVSFSHTAALMPNGMISLGSDETKDNNLAENWVTVKFLNVLYE